MHDNSIPNSAHIVKKKYRRSANWDITLRCGTVLALSDVEDAGLSYVPCGQIEGKDQPLLAYSHLWDIRRQVMLESYHKVSAWTLPNMTGVQLMTGLPSYRPSENSPTGYIHLADIDVERKLIDAHPDIVGRIVDVYRSYCDRTPCIIETKSGGRRLSAFSDYLDPKREYADNDEMLMEMFSLKGLSRLDHRYAILEGSIFDLPIIPKTALQEIHAIISEVATHKQHSKRDRGVVETSQISGLDLHWDASGRSQYFPTSHCQATSHKNTSRDTVQFLKIRDGVMGKCYNCGESWWEVELTPLLPVGIEPVKSLPTDHPLLANAPEHEDIYAKQHKAKLQRKTEDATEPETENLEVNRAKRDTAVETFLTSTENDTLHLLLVKDSTGTGKTYTLLAKAQQHEKRTLAQVPHTDLAKQAVSIAWEHGFKDPFHLLGRGHNWDDSGIAVIPVASRTAELFDKNNCIMFDQVQEYTEKRLAPRTYCEHRCGFRDGCRHLAQYKGLGSRDFVVSCTPNLLFDLNMRGYLQSLVTATDEPSDEELAIDAILGTESEATENFDFAIIDDYGINGLYTDIKFRESEFKKLKKAWYGTPTARFAALVLKAFKKKKPAKIVKALRNAFESTSEHHTEISEALTQHARTGTVEYAELPKGSKETQRMLAEKQVIYDDGGTQFIPVDFDAYKELTDKGIPTFHPEKLQTQEIGEQVCVPHTPTHALIAGVSVKGLTPVWQKGATPIEVLEIFFDALGNDKNAPINRTFAAGDTPSAVLTFSIPPQAPIGILPQIAMLSATTDPTDTQRGFAGQDVTFSVHEGGSLGLASGVQVYQYTDARLTSASVFSYPTDAAGRRKLQEQPIGLTPTAEKRLDKCNDWAKQVDGTTAFISFKEFTEDGTPLAETVNEFDILTHFDKVAGLNFDGLKFLVVFGYPKVKHEIVMEQARKQYASDSEPLPKVDPTLRDDNGEKISEYMQLSEDVTVTENGITITERRYKDHRLEKIRHQLATEKLEQAIGRARLPVWTDIRTLIFTDAPIGNITERATLFSSAAFNLAETPDGLAEAMDRIAEVEDSGDVKEVMETKQVSERTARRQTQQTRQQTKAERNAEIVRRYAGGAGETQQEIADALGIGLATVNRVLKA